MRNNQRPAKLTVRGEFIACVGTLALLIAAGWLLLVLSTVR